MNFLEKSEWFFSLSIAIALFPVIGLADQPDWANPPVACIEDLVPKLYPCLDLSTVIHPLADLPPLSAEETRFWTVDHRPDLSLCRAKEVERRETIQPGSQAPSDLAWAWMWVKQAEDLGEKISAIYDAAEKMDMPPQILYGALKQESLLSNLGISEDGANFSCGIGQINLIEWCQYMHTLPVGEQNRMGWLVGTSCESNVLTTELVRPFYNIALKKLGGRPDYELTPKEFAGITRADVVAHFPAGNIDLQETRFRAVTSFARYCTDLHPGIEAKGTELRRLFDHSVPDGLKKVQIYSPGTTFPLACQHPYHSKFYPLHTGWLLADAIYNAGDRQVSVLEYYYRMTKTTHESGAAWSGMTPLGLIEGLHWGGKWNAKTKMIEYTNVYGNPGSQSWFKTCVVQRHIARVIQYATLPGITIANSLEQGGCSQSTVPTYRKKSTGRIPAKKHPHQRQIR